MAVNFVQHNRCKLLKISSSKAPLWISESNCIHVIVNNFFSSTVNIDESDVRKAKQNAQQERKPDQPKHEYNNNKGKRNKDNGEKATDDYHYERFKKQFRRF